MLCYCLILVIEQDWNFIKASALEKIGEDATQWLPVLNSVILPDVDLAHELDDLVPEIRTSLLSHLLVRIIERLTENRPIAIFIDDAQWMVFYLQTYLKDSVI